ncbi:TPA: hypothetical protein RQK80_004782, partial [Vibrio vulnificus]|nr:hypothetical protein [Vibrio vulnificus]
MKNHHFSTWEDSNGSNLNMLKDHLSGYQNLNLFTDKVGKTKPTESMLHHSMSVSPSLASKLALLSESNNAPYDEIFLAAFFVFLANQTGEKDLVVGEQRGNALSTPIRQIIESDETVTTLLKRLNKVRESLPECADIFSLSKVLEVDDNDRHPIYQALFVGINTSLPGHETLTSLDITLSVQMHHAQTVVELHCSSLLVQRGTLERFVTGYLEILKGF